MLALFVIILLTIICVGLYQLNVLDPQLWGRTIPNIYSEKICNQIYAFGKEDGLNFQSGSFAVDKSKSKTTVCHYKCSDNSNTSSAMVTFLYIDDLLYADSLIVNKKDFNSFFSFKDDKTTSDIAIKYRLYIPFTMLNVRIVPKGNFLSVWGIKAQCLPTETTETGLYNVKFLEGEFKNIAFLVQPNNGFTKNVVKEIRFHERQYGALFFLESNRKCLAMLLLSVPLCKKEEFGKYKDFSNKIINSLKIHPLK